MENIRRCAGVLALLLVMLSTGIGGAQDTDEITAVGSRIVNSLIDELTAGGDNADIDFDTTGTTAGIDRFCNGDIDMVTATRPMTSAEAAICGANDVVHSEFLIAHRIVAFIAHPDAPLECLDGQTLELALKPTSSNSVTDWSFYAEEQSDLAFSLIIPSDDQIEYVLVDGLVAGDGLRRDVQTYADAAEAVALVSETAGALAFLPWDEALADEDSIALLEFGGEAVGVCVLPSAENVEGGAYGAAQSLYVTVNRNRFDTNPSLQQLMRFLTDETNLGAIRAAGFSPATSAAYNLNTDVLTDADAVLASSNGASAFAVPADLSGTVNIVGAASAHRVLARTGDRLTQQNARLELSYLYGGAAAGINSLCSGEADIAVLDAALMSADLDACAANEMVTLSLDIGSQATVLVAHAAEEHTACLTTDQINSVWQGDSAEIIENWSDVAPGFPEQPITLFGLTILDQHTDMLLQTAGQVIPPIRRDTEQDFSPLYRAAAVGNVAGALTYMSWRDYQRVLENEQANIQLVAVDGGAGCIEASPASIEDGSYPLSRSVSLLIREAAMADINVKSYLWTLLDETNWSTVESDGFIGVSAVELPTIRRDVLRAFAEAEAKFPPAVEPAESPAEDDSGEADSG